MFVRTYGAGGTLLGKTRIDPASRRYLYANDIGAVPGGAAATAQAGDPYGGAGGWLWRLLP